MNRIKPKFNPLQPFAHFVLSPISPQFTRNSLIYRHSTSFRFTLTLYISFSCPYKPYHNSSCEPTATGRRSKKSSRIAPMPTESLTRIFLTFLLMQRDSKRICKRYRLRLLRFRLFFDMPLSCNIYCPKESKCRHLQNPSKISLVLPRYNQNQKINQKTNPCKRLRGGSFLC